MRGKIKRTWGTAEQKIVAARQKWACANCSCILPSSFELDHRIPLWAGGADCCETNADALCPTCHANKTQAECIERTRLIRKRRADAIREAAKELTNDPPPMSPPPLPLKKPKRQPRSLSPTPTYDPVVDNNPFLKYAYVGDRR